MPDALTLDDLIAWGRDYEKLLKDTPRGGFQVPRPVLDHYIAAANEALAQKQQREQARIRRPSGGRPRGGMGEQVKRLVGNGTLVVDALRAVANQRGKPIETVKRAYDRVSKKTPR